MPFRMMALVSREDESSTTTNSVPEDQITTQHFKKTIQKNTQVRSFHQVHIQELKTSVTLGSSQDEFNMHERIIYTNMYVSYLIKYFYFCIS